MKEIVLITIGGFLLASSRAAIKAYRAKKNTTDIVVDAIEAGLDAVDHKNDN